jgi:hypothetical protein
MLRKHKVLIQTAIDKLIESISKSIRACPEAVANEAFYRLQRNPSWGRNANKIQKKAAFRLAGAKCERCRKPLSFKDAVFHHRKRGIPNQHEFPNLVPHHKKCHDAEHNVELGSLLKGSPRKMSTAR